MTYEHYSKQPMQMIEWFLNKLLAEIPEHGKMFGNISHTSIRKYHRMILDGEIQDLE